MASIFNKIFNNDVEGLKILLEEEPGQINKQPIDRFGRTPLMWASQVGADRRIIDILIKAGSELEAKDNCCGRTALHWAVDWCRLQAVELLLSEGSNVNEKSSNGNTPLHLTADSFLEWTDGVKALMKPKAVEVNPRNVNGQTPLHLACYNGYIHTVGLLLGHNGIDASVVNNKGDTPLHMAVQGQRYGVVSVMLKQDSVNLEIVNKKYRTPLLEAVLNGHLGIMQRLIARGANVNALAHGGNNCLHLALATEEFNSEVEHMTMLDQFCVELKLGNEERCSGVVVASYLAHHGANFYCKNKSGRTPLDLIKKENLKKMLKTLFPPQCHYCHENMATVRLQPCGDLVLCENCSSEMTFKRCPVCRENTLSKSEFGAPKSEDRCVKKEATCQELGAASQAIESPVLKERDLLRVANRLGRDWWQIAIFLEVDTTELKIDDESIDTVKEGYLMLKEWFKNCDPETRTHATLSAALEEAECFAAMECLSLDAK
ncbi:E3 ubiquitin-protein ligase MIB2-like isoform X1 [Octopus vulgaris]|uniref:E3 ubiquitin-protein ligase MIB2-like isoform X1 n=1 Tax=Octopus vulgaris TaxID=6645 RepID=A0AA36HIK2_OCTVU|nr:E3 ubiquitin-protein ligase MIB2-like isoform X1 [Octopus vulgaris]